jgi:hypothetical protein
VIAQGREPLIQPSIFRYREMDAGLNVFFVQYLVQAAVFFTIPLFLSVALGLSALQTGGTDSALVHHAAGRSRRHPQALSQGVTASGG